MIDSFENFASSIRICGLCVGKAPPKHEILLPNVGKMKSSQYIYCREGSVTFHNSIDSGNKTSVNQYEFKDISSLRNKELYGIAGDRGFSWIGINPINIDENLECKFIENSNDEFSFEKTTYVLCLDGTCYIDNKKFTQLNFCRIERHKEVHIRSLEESKILLIQRNVL